jgi:tRNA pseudouridine55 synthase
MSPEDPPAPPARPFGFLNVYKPVGPTSHDAVAAVRRLLPRRTKVGHAGTLDPLADGVLVVCVGPATRLADIAREGEKRYRATFRLGAVSTTDDREGEIAPTDGAGPCDESAVRRALDRQVGQILQVPPAHSAVHVDGERAYHLARSGRHRELPPRRVRIDRIELLELRWPDVEVRIACGTGTYIRSIARDLGAELGVGGYCHGLTREAVGPFEIADAVDYRRIDLPADLLPATAGLGEMPRLRLPPDQIDRLRRGLFVQLDADHPPGPAAAIDDERDVLAALAVVRPDGRELRPRKVFPEGR